LIGENHIKGGALQALKSIISVSCLRDLKSSSPERSAIGSNERWLSVDYQNAASGDLCHIKAIIAILAIMVKRPPAVAVSWRSPERTLLGT
jgi:hypothetical protein